MKEDKEYNQTKNEEEEDDLKAKVKKKKTYFDGITTLIGSQIHSIGFGSVYALSNLHTYLISYLRFHQEEEKTLTLQYIYFISLVMSIGRGFFTPFVSFFENKLGLIKAIILGALIDISGTAIIYFSKNYYIDLFGFLIISLGQSLTALRRRNVMSYFFYVRGKLSGIISVINAFITAGYNIICEKWIVNPNSEEAIYDKEYYSINVSENILNYIQFIWCCAGFGTLISLLLITPFDEEKHGKGLFAPKNNEKKIENNEEKKENIIDDNENIKTEPLIPDSDDEEENQKVNDKKDEETIKNENEEKKEKIDIEEENQKINDKKDEETIKNENEEKKENIKIEEENQKVNDKKDEETIKNENEEKPNENSKKTSSSPAINSSIENEETLKVDENSKEQEPKAPKKTIHNRFDLKVIKKALKSKRILRFFLMGIFSAPLGNFIMNTWRNIGIRKRIPTIYLQNIGTYSPFAMFSSAFIFSWLSDYIPFRYIVSLLSLCSSINGILFCFSLNNPTFFTIVLLANTFFGMGIFSVYEPHFLKVFGIKHYIELGGVISLPGVFMGPICTVFIFIFENIFADSINSQDGSDLPYYILFITSSILNLVSSTLSFFESEEEITAE